MCEIVRENDVVSNSTKYEVLKKETVTAAL